MSDRGVRPIRSSGLPTRIRLIERLDRGSFGEVWLARDTAQGVDVAVKFLDLGSAGIDGDRFEREARSLARLAGIPGIVTIRELGVAPDGTPWLVTEFLRGGSLRFKLDVEAPEPWSQQAIDLARSLLAPLAAALASAHELGVVHGDISPANVLFDASGSPKLADFGMAELSQFEPAGPASGDGSGPIRPGGLTPAYASPERLRGDGPSERADVYALGATLWHVLTGEPRPSTAATRVEALTDPIAGVLESAISTSPRLRPTAQELAEALTPTEKSGRRWRYRRSNGKR